MTMTTKTASALVDEKLGIPKGMKKTKKKSGKYPQRTRPMKRPQRSR